MARRPATLTVLAAMAGFAIGYGFRETAREKQGSTFPPDDSKAAAGGTSGRTSSIHGTDALHSLPSSSDRLEDLLAEKDDITLYSRLALWSLDASAEDLHSFWTAYSKRPDANRRIARLLFTTWTRTDPEGALAAAKTGNHEDEAWAAWAENDPRAAFTAALSDRPGTSNRVLRTLSLSQPRLALQLLEEHPEIPMRGIVDVIAEGLVHEDPDAAVSLLLENRRIDTSGWRVIELWTRNDPKAALEWLQANPKAASGNQTFFFRALRENPEMLATLAESAQPGELKWKLQYEHFKQLAGKDPEAVLASARANESPRAAAEQFAIVGMATAERDPQGAQKILEELYKACPDAEQRNFRARLPDNSIVITDSGAAGVNEFLEELIRNDPETTLQTAIRLDQVSDGAGSGNPRLITHAASLWAEKKPDDFIAWLDTQDDARIRHAGSGIAMNRLSEQGRYQEAIEWAAELPDPEENGVPYVTIVSRWARQDLQAATEWLENSGLSEKAAGNLKRYLQAR